MLFCDLRGFSRTSERSADDLLGLLDRVSLALGRHHATDLRAGRRAGRFSRRRGDGILGLADRAARRRLRACRAAWRFAASSHRRQRPDDPLADFRVGIGIATGKAVAGKIGTVDQVKVTVFGPVVNLAARLEGMTKTLQAPILVDERTAALVRSNRRRQMLAGCDAWPCQSVRPRQTAEVSELLPPRRSRSDADRREHGRLRAGPRRTARRPLAQAFERLHRVPAEDRVKDFLTMFIVQHNRTAPEGWNGVIPLTSK